ncbi:Peroxisome biogenesis 5 -like protein [Gossypium arboreum]|uniref:Peroxisome biogenesis 5-like protein n=1 Tax=Gossypium arboreum TaxID=29729 RepID=A0A0B0P1E2_GOSAR|nr:Peroxisome biogenesis 5 -like protein [Gossypium arboreum]
MQCSFLVYENFYWKGIEGAILSGLRLQSEYQAIAAMMRAQEFDPTNLEMSRRELIIDENQVKPASENWATEYQQQYNGGASWADEFAHDEANMSFAGKESLRGMRFKYSVEADEDQQEEMV